MPSLSGPNLIIMGDPETLSTVRLDSLDTDNSKAKEFLEGEVKAVQTSL